MDRQYSRVSKEEEESESSFSSGDASAKGLLEPEIDNFRFPPSRANRGARVHVAILYTLITVLSVAVGFLLLQKPKNIALGDLFSTFF